MAKYVCRNCNYRSYSESVGECGFCGMKCIEEEKNAEELLDEVSKLF